MSKPTECKTCGKRTDMPMHTCMTTPTDTQLKKALAKMLPEKVFWRDDMVLSASPHDGRFDYRDTELLHLCRLVGKSLPRTMTAVAQSPATEYVRLLEEELGTTGSHFATWQQRTTALSKVLGVKIV